MSRSGLQWLEKVLSLKAESSVWLFIIFSVFQI